MGLCIARCIERSAAPSSSSACRVPPREAFAAWPGTLRNGVPSPELQERRRAGEAACRVWLLGPGSGEAGPLLAANFALYVAIGHSYDSPNSRMPPGWSHMRGVDLNEAAAEASGIEVVHVGRPSCNAKNLATWASVIFAYSEQVQARESPETRPVARCWSIDIGSFDVETVVAGHVAADSMGASTHAQAEGFRRVVSGRTVGEPNDCASNCSARITSPRTIRRRLRQSASRDRRSSREWEDQVLEAATHGRHVVGAKAPRPTPLPEEASEGGGGEAVGEVDQALGCCDAAAADVPAESCMTPRDVSHFDCLLCGSRGGQVTLVALWRLGCRLPCVVINGGCARAEAGWAWPAGVPVVLLTGGDDFFNPHRGSWEPGESAHDPHDDRHDPLRYSDRAYVHDVWNAIPEHARSTAALVHVPSMGHHPDPALLSALLPKLVAWAAAGLAPEAKPTGDGLQGKPCLLLSASSAGGEWLC